MVDDTPLHRAILNNRVAAVKQLLKGGRKVDYDSLFLAIEIKANAVLKELIQAGANLEALHHDFTPLTEALHDKNLPAFKMLLKAGASPNKKCSFGAGGAPLHFAVSNELLEAVKLLIAAGANLEARDCNKATPLIYAARHGQVEIIKVLLKAGANPQSVDVSDRNAYEYALVENRAEAAEVLAPVSRIIPKKGIAALIEAVEKQDMAAVEKCLATGVDVNAMDKFGRSPLDKAIELGSVVMVKRLIQAGIHLNKVDPDGISFLEGAVRAQQREVIRVLLEAGAKPNPPGNKFRDALYSLVAMEDVELAKLMIKKGSVPRTSGALTLAAQMHAVEIVRLLLSEGADVNEVNELSTLARTPLFEAVSTKPWIQAPMKFQVAGVRHTIQPPTQVEIDKVHEFLKFLLDSGADVNRMDEQGRTPLSYASWPSVARMLIEAGAKLDIRDLEGHPVSYWLKKNGVKSIDKSPDRSAKQPKRQAAPHVSETIRPDAFIKVIRIPYKNPYHLKLRMVASNGRRTAETEFYVGTKALTDWAANLKKSTRQWDNTYIWQCGSELPEDKCAYYLMLRVITTGASGRPCTIHLRFKNNIAPTEREISEFRIQAEASALDRLGRLFREFARLEHEVLMWTPLEGKLFKTIAESDSGNWPVLDIGTSE